MKNIKKYKEIKESFNDVEEPYITLGLPPLRIDKNLRNLLTYRGFEDLQIPGAFLEIFADTTDLHVPQIIDILNISKSTFYRIKDDEVLETEIIDKLASVLKIYNLGIKAFGDKNDFHLWLNSRVINLGNKMPIDLLNTENGRAAVLDAIDRIEYGIYG